MIFKFMVYFIDGKIHKILPEIGNTSFKKDQIDTYNIKRGLDKLDFYLRYRYRETDNVKYRTYNEKIFKVRTLIRYFIVKFKSKCTRYYDFKKELLDGIKKILEETVKINNRKRWYVLNKKTGKFELEWIKEYDSTTRFT